MRIILLAMVMLLTAFGRAAGHSGHGGSTEVRVFPDKMKIVIRTTLPFAWARLGAAAPARADQDGRTAALPLLVAAAPSMLRVTEGGVPMKPTDVDCMFELEDHVAFILNFPRPTKWPVELDAQYVRTLGELDTATVTVYDQTASRFARDIMPLLEKNVFEGDSMVSFSLGPAPVAQEIKQPAANAAAPKTVTDKGPADFMAVFLIAAALIVVSGWFWMKRRPRAK